MLFRSEQEKIDSQDLNKDAVKDDNEVEKQLNEIGEASEISEEKVQAPSNTKDTNNILAIFAIFGVMGASVLKSIKYKANRK